MHKSLLFLLFLLPFSLHASGPSKLHTGSWRAIFIMPDNQELPFNFEVKQEHDSTILYIMNGRERIRVDEVMVKRISEIEDSVIIRLPVFDTEILGRTNGTNFSGLWINNARKTNNTLPLLAEYGPTYRFTDTHTKAAANISGKWETDFSPGTADSSKALGVFQQEGNHLSGTFLSPTGDYRYLEGVVEGNNVMLSAFDGAHAFLFVATINKDHTLSGTFYSGNHWKESWTARHNEKYTLPDPNSLTFLKPGYRQIAFSFPDLNHQQLSLSDPQFRDKVVILQIMGSWCPNCMDESAFLSDFYRKKHNKGLEIIGLSFEKTPDFEKAKANLERMQKRFNITYPLLIAGTTEKESKEKALPMINQIMSFPTTIIIDRKGNVRRIHTGYSGPATGRYYDEFVDDFNRLIDKLLAE